MHGNYGMYPMYWGGWMFLWPILMISLIAGAGFFIFRQIEGKKGEKSALDILKERYAKGEMTKQEFEEKKRDIL
jgi:putative membrane protein